MKFLDGAIVHRGGWVEACILRRNLSMKGEVLKARECEEERRERGGHMSL